MRLVVLPFSLVFALEAAGAGAGMEDPLWVRATASASLAKNAVASRIVTRTEVFDGGGKKLESNEKVEELTGWDGEKPLIKSETKWDVGKAPGMGFRLTVKATDNPFYASRQGLVTYNRVGEDTLDGKSCVRFQFEEAPAPTDKSGEGPTVGTAWVERESGLPVKVESHPKKLPAHASAYTVTMLFEVRPDGSAVPREVHVDTRGGFLFIKRVVRLHQNLTDWTTPPNVKD